MKKYLLKRQQRLEAKKAELVKRSQETTDVNELRAINDEIMDIANELHDIADELADLAKNGDDDSANNDGGNAGNDQGGDAQRSAPPATAKQVNGDVARNVVGSFAAPDQRSDDPYASLEYRKAFMAYAQRGEAIPTQYVQRDGEPANTTDLGATIPTTVLNEFINEIRVRYGQLYNKVRKLTIKGAVKVPIAKLQAQFKWVTESTVSPRQNGGTINDYVEFSYNMAEIRVSQTLLSSIVTLDLFEREIIRIMTIAFLQAMDDGIVNGTGNGQMLGILNDPRVTGQTGHVIQMSANDMSNWTAWRKNFFAKLPLGYRAGEFIFSLGTVDTYLETMADSNNNPIFRQATGLEVNDGDSRNPNGRFFGRDITLVEPDILPDFDSAEAGDVIGIFWQPEEYAINTNMAFGMRRWFDEDRNEWVNKMLTIVDGKVLNPCGYYLITKKGS